MARKEVPCLDCGIPHNGFRERCGSCGAKLRHRINRFRFTSESLGRIGQLLANIRTYIHKPQENLVYDGYVISAQSIAADLERLEKDYAEIINEGMVNSINQHLNNKKMRVA